MDLGLHRRHRAKSAPSLLQRLVAPPPNLLGVPALEVRWIVPKLDCLVAATSAVEPPPEVGASAMAASKLADEEEDFYGFAAAKEVLEDAAVPELSCRGNGDFLSRERSLPRAPQLVPDLLPAAGKARLVPDLLPPCLKKMRWLPASTTGEKPEEASASTASSDSRSCQFEATDEQHSKAPSPNKACTV